MSHHYFVANDAVRVVLIEFVHFEETRVLWQLVCLQSVRTDVAIEIIARVHRIVEVLRDVVSTNRLM